MAKGAIDGLGFGGWVWFQLGAGAGLLIWGLVQPKPKEEEEKPPESKKK